MRVAASSDERPRVLGPTIDQQTRCVHYGTPLDVIAIRFACCGDYYPCHLCHEADAGHAALTWPASERDQYAVLCGVCGGELTIAEYRDVEGCPACSAPFNPGCSLHAHLYFDADDDQSMKTVN